MAMDITMWMEAEVQITPADLFRALPVDPKDDGYSQSPMGQFEKVANVVIYAHRWLKRAHDSLDEVRVRPRYDSTPYLRAHATERCTCHPTQYYRQQLEVDLAELSTERLPPFDDDEPLKRSPKRKLEVPEVSALCRTPSLPYPQTLPMLSRALDLTLPQYYQQLLEIDRTEAAIGQLPPWDEPEVVASKKTAPSKKQVSSGSYDSTMTAFEFELEAINLY